MSRGIIHLIAGGRASIRAGGDPLLAQALAWGRANAGGDPDVARPSLAYVGAASGDNRAFLAMISGYLKGSGAGRITLAPMAGRKFDRGRTRAVLEEADVVFVSGGDVEEGMSLLEKRGMSDVLRDLSAAGKPVVGLSAGSIMIGSQWVRWEDPDDDATAGLFPCLGLAPLACDTHGEGEGWEELRMFVSLGRDGAIGYGIPSGALLRVHPDGRLEALGEPVHRFARRAGVVRRETDLDPDEPGARP